MSYIQDFDTPVRNFRNRVIQIISQGVFVQEEHAFVLAIISAKQFLGKTWWGVAVLLLHTACPNRKI
jgi:hypothetical protein